MAIIREIKIIHFRAIESLIWHPSPGLNCIIGPGDEGKSTVLDAIELTLGTSRNFTIVDADFNKMDVSRPIEIFITLGDLENDFLNLELYGHYLRGFDGAKHTIVDEGSSGTEHVITIRFSVAADLEPEWQLYSERAEEEGRDRWLPWKHRQLIAPTRLGTTASHHLAWGPQSILSKMSPDTSQITSPLPAIARQVRLAFSKEEFDGIDGVLAAVKRIANDIGVPVSNLYALLDDKGLKLNSGAIALHDGVGVPLRNLGAGSSRLLVAGLQHSTSSSPIVLIDEAEFGLEPFRIVRLLNTLGSKHPEPKQQVFLTTHSPFVLRELSASQINVIRTVCVPPPPPTLGSAVTFEPFKKIHRMNTLGQSEYDQSTLRVCAESFLAKAVIVCEGKTEIGILKGLDLYLTEVNNRLSMHAFGVSCADGAGDNMYRRALTFARLGYQTILFKDSDKTPNAEDLIALTSARVKVFEWGNNQATEEALYNSVPQQCIDPLLRLAIELKGEVAVNAHISNASNNAINLSTCLTSFDDSMRPFLGRAAKKDDWYKDIDPAEWLMRFIVGPYWPQLLPNQVTNFYHVLNQILEWIYRFSINNTVTETSNGHD